MFGKINILIFLGIIIIIICLEILSIYSYTFVYVDTNSIGVGSDENIYLDSEVESVVGNDYYDIGGGENEGKNYYFEDSYISNYYKLSYDDDDYLE